MAKTTAEVLSAAYAALVGVEADLEGVTDFGPAARDVAVAAGAVKSARLLAARAHAVAVAAERLPEVEP